MLSTAVSLAVLSTIAFVLVYSKMPRRVRRFLEKYSLATDIAALLATYLLFGSTVTALLAGAMVGIFTSILLHVANNKQDFLFLWDAAEFMKEQLAKLKILAKECGDAYRDKREAECPS